VILEAVDVAQTIATDGERQADIRRLQRGSEEWQFDSDEEFFAEYRNGFTIAHYMVRVYNQDIAIGIHVHVFRRKTDITVQAGERKQIERVFDVFERYRAESELPKRIPPDPSPPPLTVFVGHGGSSQWRDLKDHLHEQHGYTIEAYEIGARAGHAIRDILVEMLTISSFAILVMTAEDETAEGGFRARQNVIHEIGLFQGRLGFSRAIVLVEEGTEVFSNLQGIQQLRYSKGNIKETYGDILATLRREFGPS